MKAKKILSLLMTTVMIAGLIPQMVLAADTQSINLETVSTSGTGYTFEEITVNNKAEYVVTITDSGDYQLTGTVDQDNHPTHVVVSATTANITLSNASITILNFSPISIDSGSTVNLTLAEGTVNTLSLGDSEVGFAGLYVPETASIVIGGTGTLTVQGGACGAGIGGTVYQYDANSGLNENAGSITINGGVINATGGPYGAGIGGASDGYGGTVTINGGQVTAISSITGTYNGGAGIGGGFRENGSITINGGTVNATSGYNINTEAIGSGTNTFSTGSSVILNGGSVIAHSPMNIWSVPKNNSGANVYQTIVTVQDSDSNTLNNSQVSCTAGTTTFTSKTDSDGKLYLWLPAGNASIDISAGGVSYRAVGTVTETDSTAFTADEILEASINGTKYKTWADAVAAVQSGETITILKDIGIPSENTMPTVACTINGDFHTLALNSDQSLNADITLKNLCITAADSNDYTLNFSDILNNSHNLNISGTVGVSNVYIDNGAHLSIDGTLEVNEIDSFDTIKVSVGSSISAFAVRNISNLELNGTIICKYFNLKKSTGDSGTLSGNGKLLFSEAGGESPNLSFSNVKIDSNAQITLDVFECTFQVGDILVGNKPLGGATTATALENIDNLILGNGYSGMKLTDKDYGFEYDYMLSAKPALKTPSISLVADTVNGGLAYTITPASDETGTVSGYKLQMLESDGTTEVGDEIICTGTSGNIPISSTILIGSSYCAKVKAVTDATSDNIDSVYSVSGPAVEVLQPVANSIPTLAPGFNAVDTYSNYTINSPSYYNLGFCFVDADNDPLNYKVSINGALPVTVNQIFTFTIISTGTTTFEFTANDGKADSQDTYTMIIIIPDSDVNSVTVTPATASIQRGTTPQTFSATVIGTNNPSQSVTWGVTGGISGTSIDSNGMLTVAGDEPASALTVTATSTQDSTQFGTAAITVMDVPVPPAVVDRVTITPSTVAVLKGNTQTFSAAVTGTNSPSQSVIWSVSGGDSSTNIDSNGVLTVAEDENASLLTVRATSAEDNTKFGEAVVTVSTVTPQTYALTVTAGTGGSITTGNSGNYATGTIINISATSSGNYRFNGWTSTSGGSFANSKSISTTFIMPEGETSILANFKHRGSSDEDCSSSDGSSGGGSSLSNTQNTKTDYTADVLIEDIDGKIIKAAPLEIVVDKQKGIAMLTIGSEEDKAIENGEMIDITAPSISGINEYTLDIPVDDLAASSGTGTLTFNSDTGTISLPSNMLEGIAVLDGKNAQITISNGVKPSLSDAVKEAKDERPLIRLTVTVDGKKLEWNNPNAPVKISIPYTPSEDELENSESIVIWYIDGSGNAVTVPNGYYDSTTGTVTFSTTHFSYYAVGYNKVTFEDVAPSAWYNKAVGFIAARDIATGTGNGNYSPEEKLTRSEFLVMMMKTYGLSPDTDVSDNFFDAEIPTIQAIWLRQRD